MKPSLIFQQYVWLVNTLRCHKRGLTLAELDKKWTHDEVAEGNPLSRSTFNRHRDAILYMFGIIIECNANDEYRYYIQNPDALGDDSIRRWMLSTLTVGSVLSDSMAIKDHIMLEDIPNGEEFLGTIIKAIKTCKKVRMGYQKFGDHPYEKVVSPYALRLYHQRWYIVAHNGKWIATYSLDRMTSLSLSDETFTMPDDFSPKAFFAEYFGIMVDRSAPLEHVVIRAYHAAPNYLRTLPLHHTQREVNVTDDYVDFAIDIHTTWDFVRQLLRYGSAVEVLQPEVLREMMKEEIAAMSSIYS